MSTIQEQKKKQLTFEEICPLWSKKIKYKTSLANILDISNYKYCIVGEAHGFTMNYSDQTDPNMCTECFQFSNGLCTGCFQFSNGLCGMNDLETKIANFTQHWNEVHLNK
jgi:hypothetical protein